MQNDVQVVLNLNAYQCANLKNLIKAIRETPELNILDSGDWCGEIYHSLPNVEYQPNQPIEYIQSWFARYTKNMQNK